MSSRARGAAGRGGGERAQRGGRGRDGASEQRSATGRRSTREKRVRPEARCVTQWGAASAGRRHGAVAACTCPACTTPLPTRTRVCACARAGPECSCRRTWQRRCPTRPRGARASSCDHAHAHAPKAVLSGALPMLGPRFTCAMTISIAAFVALVFLAASLDWPWPWPC